MRISVFNCLSSANSRETQLMQHMKSNKKKPTKTRQIKKKQKRKRKKKKKENKQNRTRTKTKCKISCHEGEKHEDHWNNYSF